MLQQKTRGAAPVPLKLLASNPEDLAVLGALAQDALVSLKDMAFLAEESAFVMAVNRFCWETAQSGETGPWWRTHAALRFSHVTQVRKQGLENSSRSGLLSLLAMKGPAVMVAAEPVTLVMRFSGGGALELTAAPFLCSLTDLGEPWPTRWKPRHDTGDIA